MANFQNTHVDSDKQSEDFEADFLRLQQVVRTLSEGNLSLQESLSAYEEGMALAERCARALEEAELRVRTISDRTYRSAPTVYGPDEESDEQTLVALDVEALLVEGDAEEPAGPNADRGQRHQDAAPNSVASGQAKKVSFEELDPLFDEDE